jgi:hypothetical protein
MSFLCHPPPALSFGAPDMRHQLAIGRLPVPIKHRATGRRRGLSEVTNRGMSLGRTLIDLADVARAATFGAVDTVLVDVDTVVPGTIDEDSGTVTFAPENATSYGVRWTRSTAGCGSTAARPWPSARTTSPGSRAWRPSSATRHSLRSARRDPRRPPGGPVRWVYDSKSGVAERTNWLRFFGSSQSSCRPSAVRSRK